MGNPHSGRVMSTAWMLEQSCQLLIFRARRWCSNCYKAFGLSYGRLCERKISTCGGHVGVLQHITLLGSRNPVFDSSFLFVSSMRSAICCRFSLRTRSFSYAHKTTMRPLREVFDTVQSKTPKSLGSSAWYLATVSRCWLIGHMRPEISYRMFWCFLRLLLWFRLGSQKRSESSPYISPKTRLQSTKTLKNRSPSASETSWWKNGPLLAFRLSVSLPPPCNSGITPDRTPQVTAISSLAKAEEGQNLEGGLSKKW